MVKKDQPETSKSGLGNLDQNSSTSVAGRLAPSPTGAQHVGNARTYLTAWLAARFESGRIYLRMEDIDSPRIKTWAADQAIKDLQWLGLDWDPWTDQVNKGQVPNNDSSPYQEPHSGTKEESQRFWVQTTRTGLYQTLLEELIKRGKVYRCFCSRKDIQQAASAPHESADAVRYPDICRDADHPEDSTRPFAWRYRTEPKEINYLDGILGQLRCQVHTVLGDFVIAKSDGSFSYQLAATFDDQQMGVNQVVRGDDLYQSTFRQICLQSEFGWNRPNYFHLPLVVGPDGRRLAKRHGDTRLSVLQEKGKGPEELIGILACSLGFTSQPDPISAQDLLQKLQSRYLAFPWDLIPKDPYILMPNTWNQLCR